MSILEQYYRDAEDNSNQTIEDLILQYLNFMDLFEKKIREEKSGNFMNDEITTNGPVFQKIPLPVKMTDGRKVYR